MERLTVKTPSGIVNVKATNITNPTLAEPVDWVLVATKTYDAESAATWFPSLCKNGAPVAVIQNGVEHRERFAPYVKAELILPVIIDCPVERQPDGSINQRGVAQMKIPAGTLGGEFAELLKGSGAQVELTDDFLTAAWRKLCINAAGVVSALTMKPAGVLRDPALGNLALDIVAECAAVGCAEGAELDDNIGQQVLDGYRAQPPDSVNSLLADRLAERQTEIEARNGVIVRLGEKHGILTPLNRMAVALIRAPSGAMASL
jgi:2-dehydropantoate 2-reductase